MKIQPIVLLIFLLLSTATNAQDITGKFFDSTENKAVSNAVIAILTPKDSILLKFARSNAEGNFTIKGIAEGKYIFMVTHPIYAGILDDITVGSGGLAMNVVKATPKSKLLREVIIKSGSPIKIKGDTVSYTADSFKVSANANVEELLKKLPGIQIDKNGEIKAMGEKVEKVLVDGEEFFGDDPGMAIKNLRADAVKEVQVFDKKTEQAEFTGIDDGQKQKTINLKLKDDSKKGYFGKIDVAAGPQKHIDNRYNSNLMFSAFRGKRKFSAFNLNGNTGQDGLNWGDQDKYGGDREDVSMSMDEDGGMMWMWRGGGSDDEPYINTENGFITNNNAGIHYSNKWNDKTTLTLSPKFNRQLYDNVQTNFTQRPLEGTTLINEYSTQNQNISRSNFKNGFTLDNKFDSSNSLKITLKANFYHTETNETVQAHTNNDLKELINSSQNIQNNKSDKNALTGTVLFRHKFKKARRTFSLNAEWNRIATDGTNFLKSNNQIYSNGIPVSNINKDQMFDIDKATQKLSSKITYTEPISKKMATEIAYEIIYSKGKNNRTTYNYTAATGKYDSLVDTLSNNFDQIIIVNKPSLKFNYNHKKIKFSFGSGFGFTNFDLKDLTYNSNYKRNYTNLFPSASFKYTYKPNHAFNFSYNGNTTQPTINQLQPLRNNDDNFNQYIGNPNLKQSFAHSFEISHNSYNFIKDLWMYQSFSITSTVNSITNNYSIDKTTGKTITQPINTNGNLSINFWNGIGLKLKKLNTNVNMGPRFNYSKFADILNGRTNFSKTLSAGGNIWMNTSKEKKYDISLNNEFSYNRSKTALASNINSYFTNSLDIDATVYYKKVWSINASYNFFARQKTQQFQSNLTNNKINVRLQKTFKDNEFTAYVFVRDLLNQNIGIERSYYGYTTSEVVNQRLKRYFMIGFTWDFKNKSSKAEAPATPGQ